MVKKWCTSFLIICLILTATEATSFAVVKEPDASVMVLYCHSVSANLTISSDGTAEATGKINGLIGTTTKTTVHLYLQQYKDGKWIDIGDWIDSGETVNRTLIKQKSVEKGYKYRAKASCYAYAGKNYEHITKYSGEVCY